MKNQQKEKLIKELNDLIDENIISLNKMKNKRGNDNNINNNKEIVTKLKNLIEHEIDSIKNKRGYVTDELIKLIDFFQSIDPDYYDHHYKHDLDHHISDYYNHHGLNHNHPDHIYEHQGPHNHGPCFDHHGSHYNHHGPYYNHGPHYYHNHYDMYDYYNICKKCNKGMKYCKCNNNSCDNNNCNNNNCNNNNCNSRNDKNVKRHSYFWDSLSHDHSNIYNHDNCNNGNCYINSDNCNKSNCDSNCNKSHHHNKSYCDNNCNKSHNHYHPNLGYYYNDHHNYYHDHHHNYWDSYYYPSHSNSFKGNHNDDYYNGYYSNGHFHGNYHEDYYHHNHYSSPLYWFRGNKNENIEDKSRHYSVYPNCHSCEFKLNKCNCYINKVCTCYKCMLNFYHRFDWNYNCINNRYCRCYRCYHRNHFMTFKQFQKIFFDRNTKQEDKVYAIDVNKILNWIKENDTEWELFDESSNRLRNLIPDLSSPESEKKNFFIISYLTEKHNYLQARTEDYLSKLLNKIRQEENTKFIDLNTSGSNSKEIPDYTNKIIENIKTIKYN